MSNIHKLADVQSLSVGDGTNIWQFCVVFKDAVIGENCNICANVIIENFVTVGDRVTVKSGVQLWDGLCVEDDVFIGPNVTFTNDLTPRSKVHKKFLNTTLRRGCSIGANVTIITGLVIGEYAMIGAGSVVTKSVGNSELWYGNPAQHRGYITKDGVVLDMEYKNKEGVKLEV